jgi:16S rRNA (guanine527-N7)-methyltransferase
VYVDLLLEWGARVNLTSARTAEEIVDDHVADAIAVAARIPEAARRLLDVGAGAGMPGVVLAILRPELSCTLLEPRERRWAFLREVRRRLGLEQLTLLQERLEEHVLREDFRLYDVAVSRATWPAPEWLARGLAVVGSGGRVIALEGRSTGDLPAGAQRHPYRLARRSGAVVTLDRP